MQSDTRGSSGRSAGDDAAADGNELARESGPSSPEGDAPDGLPAPAADVADDAAGDGPAPADSDEDGAPPEPGVGARIGSAIGHALRRDGHGLPILVLVVLTLVCWARPVLDDFSTLRLSNPGDSTSFEFYFRWNIWAVLHGDNPFRTPYLYAPDGQNLGNAISMPYVSLLISPVSLLFGTTVAYNVAFLLPIFLAGLSVYLLARTLFGSVVGAAIAGSLSLMSPYFVGHGNSHMNLMWVFGLPFLAFVVARYVRGETGRGSVVVWIALSLALTFGASTELAATESFFAVVVGSVALVFAPAALRPRMLRGYGWAALGGVAGIVLSVPVILAALDSGIPSSAANPPREYSSDVANLFAPTYLFRFGESKFAVLEASWLGNAAENTAYLTFPLIAFLLVWVMAVRGRMAAALWTFALTALVLSFGPYLNINGNSTIWMPWYALEKLPALNHALPGRFSAFVFMTVGLIVAHAWATKAVPRIVTAAAVVGAAVLLVPNFAVTGFPTTTANPAFITDGDYKEVFAEGDNVLVLPPGQFGPGMRWIAAADFYFSMPTGNGGGAKLPPQLSDPVQLALFQTSIAYDYTDELPGYFERYDVDWVVAPASCPGDEAPEPAGATTSSQCDTWAAIVTEALGPPTEIEGGVLIWSTDR